MLQKTKPRKAAGVSSPSHMSHETSPSSVSSELSVDDVTGCNGNDPGSIAER